ncbi:uncharacterized protein [Rutidosis leptorrhynchoides]|uniref:uncharacterized protein n=1 Tax=Rutidosis leptorrhynchoides TaxID=125765 RepID=UPI003A9A5D4F
MPRADTGKQIDDLNISFVKSFKKSIGDGRSTLFWEDQWCSSDCLKNIFPRIYRLDRNQCASIRDRISPNSFTSTAGRNPESFATAPSSSNRITQARSSSNFSPTPSRFRQNTRSATEAVFSGCSAAANTAGDPSVSRAVGAGFKWEWSREPTGRTATELAELENLLRAMSFDFNTRSTWEWSLANNGIFTVKRLSTIIDENLLKVSNQSSHKTLRNNLIPKKLEIFVWRALKKRMPVRIELDKRGIDLHSVRCPICDNDLESVDHSLFDCHLACDIWNRVFKWWNLGPYVSSNGIDCIHGKSSHHMSFGSKIWQAVSWVTTYYLWKNRNMKVFQNKSWGAPVLLNEIQVKSFEWISHRLKGKNLDWFNWLSNPSLYLA